VHCNVASENGRRAEPEEVPAFREFPLELLRGATNSFSSDQIVSESGEKAPNFVYKGRLDQNRWIAIKRFPKAAWPDAKGFMVLIFFLPPQA
jgi:BR-signaling kinase